MTDRATIRIYASTYEPEPADHDGDWHPEPAVDEEDITAEADEDTPLARAIADALIDRGVTEPSCSTWCPGVWYSSADEEINYASGERTSYSAHLVDVDPATAAVVHAMVAARR